MTTVTLTDGDEYGITANGHATGSTEMCAAISALMYGFVGWAANEFEKPQYALQQGNAWVIIPKSPASDVIFQYAKIAFLQLWAGDPEHISVEIK